MAQRSRAAHSIGDLLQRHPAGLGAIKDQVARHQDWAGWLAQRLPEQLGTRVTGVVERGGALVVFTESAGWCARLRYALAEIEPQLRARHPTLARVSVRVMPRGTPNPSKLR